MEAVDAGISRLAGTEIDDILMAMNWAYEKSSANSSTASWNNVFGDGNSAKVIARLLCDPSFRKRNELTQSLLQNSNALKNINLVDINR